MKRENLLARILWSIGVGFVVFLIFVFLLEMLFTGIASYAVWAAVIAALINFFVYPSYNRSRL